MSRNEYGGQGVLSRFKEGKSIFPLNLGHPKPSRAADLVFGEGKLDFNGTSAEGNANKLKAIADKLSGQKVVFESGGSPVFSSTISAHKTYNGGVEFEFDKFEDPGLRDELDMFKSNSFLNSLPESTPLKNRVKRLKDSLNPDVMDDGVNTVRDVFRAYDWENVSIKPVESYTGQSSGSSKNNAMENSQKMGVGLLAGVAAAAYVGYKVILE